MYEYRSILLPLLHRAGEMMKKAHTAEENGEVTVKPGSANFVTVHDLRIQEFLISEIRKVIPDARFIAEEQDNDPSVLASEHCFIIDPIDGTTNFIRDCRHSCISLAMLCQGTPTLGAVYNPYLDELYVAEKGKGATLNGRPMRVADRKPEVSLIAYGTAPYYKDTLGAPTFELCYRLFQRGADVRRCGSAALDLANLAAGRYDGFFEFLLSPWDIAAGYLLITEAGGIITDMKGNPISFSAPCPILAASPTFYPILLKEASAFTD